GAMYQNEPDAQGAEQGQVLDEHVERAGLDQLSAERDDEHLAAEGMHIRSHFAEPLHEMGVLVGGGRVGDRGLGGSVHSKIIITGYSKCFFMPEQIAKSVPLARR